MDGLQWKTLLKWIIWGYPYFWKHPFLLETSFFGLGVSCFSLEIFVGNTMTSTLPETHSKKPLKINGWKM